jgi:hypothetical protein
MGRRKGGLIPQPDASDLRLLYEQGQSTRDLAASFGVSQKTVRRWMIAAGIAGRPYTANPTPVARGGHHSWGPKIGQSQIGRASPNKGKRGPDAPNWKGGTKTIGKRVYLWDPDRKRYFPRAWFVWREAHPGELIGKGHVIHHRNGDESDDRRENLTRLTVAEHIHLHRRREAEYIKILQNIIVEMGGEFPPQHEE